MSNIKHETREGWLTEAMKELDKVFFSGNGYTLPEKLQASCGFPFGKSKAIGQCWAPTCSSDGTTQMFICPSLGEDPIVVLGTLLHEMVHACVGCEHGHKGPFRKMAKELGFEGKMTATVVPEGSDLWLKLSSMTTRLGNYPHAPMVKRANKGKGGSGWVRLVSPEDERYKVVISPKLLEEHGAPTDPWGNEMILVEG